MTAQPCHADSFSIQKGGDFQRRVGLNKLAQPVSATLKNLLLFLFCFVLASYCSK
jgi:hypothetical protein